MICVFFVYQSSILKRIMSCEYLPIWHSCYRLLIDTERVGNLFSRCNQGALASDLRYSVLMCERLLIRALNTWGASCLAWLARWQTQCDSAQLLLKLLLSNPKWTFNNKEAKAYSCQRMSINANYH